MYYEMKVHGFTLDSMAQMPVVILKDEEERHSLPIWINTMEAASIAAELISRDISTESGCCDLLTKLLSHMKLKIDRIVVDGLHEGIFNVAIIFIGGCGEIKIAARPSEALVMALKYGMSLYIAEHVLSQSSVLQCSGEHVFDGADERRYVDFLESLDTRDLGKYPM